MRERGKIVVVVVKVTQTTTEPVSWPKVESWSREAEKDFGSVQFSQFSCLFQARWVFHQWRLVNRGLSSVLFQLMQLAEKSCFFFSGAQKKDVVSRRNESTLTLYFQVSKPFSHPHGLVVCLLACWRTEANGEVRFIYLLLVRNGVESERERGNWEKKNAEN